MQILRDDNLFTDRREAALEAAEIIERIRTDEQIHVESLRLYLGELCELTLKTVDGGTMPAREVVERFWQGLVVWAVQEQPLLDQGSAIRVGAEIVFDIRAVIASFFPFLELEVGIAIGLEP